MKLAELPVYVIHGPGLVERRARLEPQLARHGLDAEWITWPDPPELTPELVRRWHRPSRWRWRWRARVSGGAPYRTLPPPEIAAYIKHVLALQRIAGGDADAAIVFEDDVILPDDFAAQFDECFASVPDDGALVFFGSCAGLHIRETSPGVRFYRKTHPATRCADSFVVRRDAARTLLRTFVPFVLPYDWELSYQLWRHDLVVYWVEPPLVRQGSEAGLVPSSLALGRGDRKLDDGLV